MPDTFPLVTHRFHVLSVEPDAFRGERLNYGIVFFDPDGRPTVRLAFEPARLRALHPDLARWEPAEQQEALQAQLDQLSSLDQRLAWIGADASSLGTLWITAADDFEQRVDELLDQMVRAPKRIQPVVRYTTKRATQLQIELKNWLKGAKLFSSRIEDLSRHRVVQNYPISAPADLYADLALKNGAVHVIETLDMRGIDRLTPTLRGSAAIKGITLDEARSVLEANSQRIAVVAASDYGVARPAISMLQRYATDVYDLGLIQERERLARFIGDALHAPDLMAPVTL